MREVLNGFIEFKPILGSYNPFLYRIGMDFHPNPRRDVTMKRKLSKVAIGLVALAVQFLPTKAEAALRCCLYVNGELVKCVTCDDACRVTLSPLDIYCV